MKKRSYILIIFIFSILKIFSYSDEIDLEKLRLITENYPPFNFEYEGKARGISSDILGEILKRLDTNLSQEDIDILPWARGFSMAESKPNTLLFSMTRTKEREKKFKWVGPIVEASRVEGQDVIIGKKKYNFKIKNIKDLNKYKIGVVRGDVVEERLRTMGVLDDNIKPVTTLKQNLQKIEYGRIDLIGYGEVVMDLLVDFGYNIKDYEKVYTIVTEPSYVYYALNLNTDDAIIEKLQGCLDQLKKEGFVDTVIESYINEKPLNKLSN